MSRCNFVLPTIPSLPTLPPIVGPAILPLLAVLDTILSALPIPVCPKD